MEIRCDCIDKEAKTVLMFGLDNAIKRVEYFKEHFGKPPEAIEKHLNDKIRELEDLKDIFLKMKECD